MNHLPLPDGIRSRIVRGLNGLDVHILEAGDPAHPALLLLHGFPELAYSWRKVMVPLAAAGFHVVAPDQRGYGRTDGWERRYDGDVRQFRLLNLARDALTLLAALGHGSAAVAGHDFGAAVAAVCALVRPDVFRRVALMSAPFSGPPALPAALPAASSAPPSPAVDPVLAALARLDPPRKHYQWYFSGRDAVSDLDNPPQGIAAFLRAYYHQKSADWPGNAPEPLPGWTAEALARLPGYYIMPLHQSMPDAVAPFLPQRDSAWMTGAELAVYAGEFGRTGFGGGLAWYRCRTEGHNADLDLFAGRTIDVPSIFIAGAQDWGVYQTPGALDRMQSTACSRMVAVNLLPGAGHWVQQEQPEATAELLRAFVTRAMDANL